LLFSGKESFAVRVCSFHESFRHPNLCFPFWS